MTGDGGGLDGGEALRRDRRVGREVARVLHAGGEHLRRGRTFILEAGATSDRGRGRGRTQGRAHRALGGRVHGSGGLELQCRLLRLVVNESGDEGGTAAVV